MAKLSRFQRVVRIIERESPYRVNRKRVRQILSVVPYQPIATRDVFDRLIAALVLLRGR